MTTKGAILGLPISLIAVVLVLIGMRFGDDPWLMVENPVTLVPWFTLFLPAKFHLGG